MCWIFFLVLRLYFKMTDNSKLTLRWGIDQATAKLATGKLESGVFEEGGFQWTIAAERLTKVPHDLANFSLSCHADQIRSWNCETEIEMHLMRANGTSFEICREKLVYYDDNTCKWLHESILCWDTMKNPKIKTNDKVTIEFRINILASEIGEPRADLAKFAAPSNRSDVILLIGDKKLHVCKDFLAVHSPVFETLFFGDFSEKGKKEVEIKEVVYEEFVDLLHVIYPGRTIITNATVLHVLALGDRFQMERVIALAEMHLLVSTKFPTAEKLKLADKYRLNDLKNSCLRTYKTVREIGTLKSAPEYANYSADVKAAICDRMMNLVEEMN